MTYGTLPRAEHNGWIRRQIRALLAHAELDPSARTTAADDAVHDDRSTAEAQGYPSEFSTLSI